jgi:hypothetical protein
MARGLGETTCLLSVCGEPSNTRRCICGAYESVGEARSSIGLYLDFYNGKRPHQSLDGATPDLAYFTKLPLRVAA